MQNIIFNKPPCFSQENTCVILAQVGTCWGPSLLRVGFLLQGWLTSIIHLLKGKKKPADGAREHTPWLLAEQAQQNSGVCTSGGLWAVAGARLWGVGTGGGGGAAAGMLPRCWLQARCCLLCLPLRLLSSQLHFQLPQRSAVSPCCMLTASGGASRDARG